MELLNDQGLRLDGRKPDELRLIKCKLGIFTHTDGSAYIEQGNTKVIAVVYGPHEVRNTHRAKTSADGAFVNCQYSMAAFSMSERKKRNRGDRKSTEATIHLHQTLAAVIRTELMPKSQIDVFIEVLQSDGGNFAATVNAATLALIDAGIPLREYVIACTASLGSGNVPMVDISNLEESLGGPTLTVAVLPRSSQIALIDMSQRFHLDFLEPVLKMAMKGCDYTFKVLDMAVESYLSEIGKPNNWGQA
ncbi:exosome complex component RRP41 [Halyomorpha halys]|uniref:exosome complex component RRP41 n=1 Tax=Halyomorpha halys TaxID=286706 RepID=UPI0006D524C0|nr:exosome complex component RRP41 [Halyomorpha halys]